MLYFTLKNIAGDGRKHVFFPFNTIQNIQLETGFKTSLYETIYNYSKLQTLNKSKLIAFRTMNLKKL